MATYNGEKYIKEQINSILPQLSSNDELIISDDGSTDATIGIVKSFNDKRIKIFNFKRDKKNIPLVRLATTNFENALKKASGDIIFLADQDDVWLPEKVSKMMYYLNERGYDYVESDCYLTDSKLNILRPSKRKNIKVNKWKSLFSTAYFQGSLCAFKRKILDDALPFPKKLQSHDRWLGYIALFKYNTLIPIQESLIYYRRHEESTIINTYKNTVFTKSMERVRYCYYLVRRLGLKILA